MNPSELMSAVQAHGTVIYVRRGNLKLDGPLGAISAGLLSDVIANREQIAAAISADPCPRCGEAVYPHCRSVVAAVAGCCPNAAERGY